MVIPPGQGRLYDMGRMKAIFKADGAETNSEYSVSEWWLEANTPGPGVHKHPEDHIFIIIEGCMSVFVDEEWHEGKKGTYIFIPGNTPHDFQNRNDSRAGFISINVAGGFESQLPSIVQWFAENPLRDLT